MALSERAELCASQVPADRPVRPVLRLHRGLRPGHAGQHWGHPQRAGRVHAVRRPLWPHDHQRASASIRTDQGPPLDRGRTARASPQVSPCKDKYINKNTFILCIYIYIFIFLIIFLGSLKKVTLINRELLRWNFNYRWDFAQMYI